MKPTLVFETGFISRLPGGFEINKERRLGGIGTILILIDPETMFIPKADAEKLAKFILEDE